MPRISKHGSLILSLIFLTLFAGCAAPTPAPSAMPIASHTPPATATPSLTPTPTATQTPLLQGVAYSPYRDCQSPSSELQPSEEDIRRDLSIIREMGNAVRTYSSTGINAKIPAIAREMGLRVSAGAWLGKDKAVNEQEIQGLIALAKEGELESVIVGNEVLLRGDLSEAELLAYIRRVKEQVDVPVTTAEIGGILLAHPKIMEAVDFQMVHLYSFWDGLPIESGAWAVVQIYQDIQKIANGKRVVIGETGWPSGGPTNNLAVPNPENQRRFASEFISLAQSEGVEFFYFDAFDEMWKTEGGVGPHWGLLDANRNFKYDIQSVTTRYLNTDELKPGPQISAMGTPHPTSGQGSAEYGQIFPVYTDFGSETNHYAPGGWMGAYERQEINTCHAPQDATWPETVIRVAYTPNGADEPRWTGAYWLEPDKNWGQAPCEACDLSPYQQLVFRARAEKSGTQVKFFVGGVTKTDEPNPVPLPYPSSIKAPIFAQEADPADGFVNLTDTWQEYHIDLREADLQNVIDGFGWAAEKARTPDGAVFYLDDIRFSAEPPPPAPLPPVHIYSGETLRTGLDMGVASSGNLYNWVENQNGVMKMSYASWQDWGVVFITVGSANTTYGHRAGLDLSQYRTLSIDMKGEQGGEIIYIGIKHRNQPDNGRETKLPVTLTAEWATYTFDLSRFTGWNNILGGVYIPIEFVFEPDIPRDEVIYFRNVQYLP